jgi:3-oxoacyl-[acyl-carrier protein] reductase
MEQTNSAHELAGKVALVTGGARNIGRAISLELAAAGAAIAVNTRSSAADGEDVVQAIRDTGGDAALHVADISSATAVATMVQSVLERHGRVDYLILNASVRTEKPFLELRYDEWRMPLSITLDGAFYLAQACLPSMIANGGGSIVTLGGMMALSGAKKRVHGSVAKHGLVGFTRGLAREFAEYNIRVNCVAPGQMNTPPAGEPVVVPSPSKIVPLGRKGEPEEIAAMVRFLCGPGASFISGQTIHVNGAQMMY